MKSWSWLACLLVSLAWMGVSFAQDEAAPADAGKKEAVCVSGDVLKVKVCGPAGWERVETPGNEKSIASFRDSESQSQIEAIGTKLINADVAAVFFDTFHQTLETSEFEAVEPPKDEKIGEIEGRLAEYSFKHTDIVLKVVVFSFVKDNGAYLVIGYFKAEERNLYFDQMKKVISSLEFG